MHSSAFQITSIEPTHTFAPLVNQIAARHELSVEFAETTNFSAPFCGNTYYVQPATLRQLNPEVELAGLESCLDEIAKMTEGMADGFFEAS